MAFAKPLNASILYLTTGTYYHTSLYTLYDMSFRLSLIRHFLNTTNHYIYIYVYQVYHI